MIRQRLVQAGTAARTGAGSALALLALAAFAGSGAAPAAAQEPPRVLLGAGLGRALIVGDDSDFLDGGSTRLLFADFRLGAGDRLHVRVEGATAGLEDDEDELTGAEGRNDLLLLVGGPQLGVTLGPVRPYVGVVAGMAAVRWTIDPPAQAEENGTDGAFAGGAHAGIAVTLDRGDHPVALRVEARLLDMGTLPFARAPGPSTPTSPGLSRVNVALLGLRAGITLGF